MRLRSLVSVLVILPLTGCSGLVASSGKNLGTLTNRTQVRDSFGTPLVSGRTDDHLEFDDFKTYQKISDNRRAEEIGMGFMLSLGLSELIFFPRELLIAGENVFTGYNMRVVYNENGTIKQILHNGLAVSTPYHPAEPAAVPKPESPPTPAPNWPPVSLPPP